MPNDAMGLPEIMWEGVGEFTRAEAFVDVAVSQYTRDIPEILAKHLLRRLRNEERRKCIEGLLSLNGLQAAYPGLADLFKRVNQRRIDVAHSQMWPPEPDKLGFTPWVGGGGHYFLTAEEVQAFGEDSHRLVGLLMTLLVELRVMAVDTEDGPRSGPDFLNNPPRFQPRLPWALDRFAPDARPSDPPVDALIYTEAYYP